MDGNLFCGGSVGEGSTFAGLPCVLILAAYALCLAVRIWERGGFREFHVRLREIRVSWLPALRLVMAGMLLTCVRDGRCTKPDGGGTNNAAAPAQQPAMQEEQAEGVQPPEGSLAGVPGGYAVLQALEGGSVTNGWWAQEGRDGTDSDGDGMPDAWERAFGLAPADLSDAAGDPDRDTVSNLDEFLNRTHPRRRDTDGDGLPDAYEISLLPDLCPWLPDDTGDADGDGLVNPCGLFMGGTAELVVTVSPNVDASDVSWERAVGAVEITGHGRTGSSEKAYVSGASLGGDTVTMGIANLCGDPPQFGVTVHNAEAETPVHIRFVFLCDSDGAHAGSESQIPALIAGANAIFRQAGVSFYSVSVGYYTNAEWYANSTNIAVQVQIADIQSGTGGLEVYFVPQLDAG